MVKNKKKIKGFYKLIKKNFNMTVLKNSSRDPFKSEKLKILSDFERWLAVSEGRPREMNWLVCEPKI